VRNYDDMSHEMVRVRVLFLEPGDLLHPSELDDGITEFSIKEKRAIYGEDYADFNVYKINSAALAESIHMGDQLNCEIVSTPNDPCVEMLVPMVVLFIDILGVNADWSGGGGLGWTVESIGIFETFCDDYDTLVEHAKKLRGRKCNCKDEWGEKVQFYAMYDYSSWRDYEGEWDCEHSLMGFFSVGDIPVRKFGDSPPVPASPPVEDVLA
jgi:hypothetical protein